MHVTTYQRNDDLAVGGGLEVVRVVEALADQTVVVDLTVDGQNDGVIGVGEGLSAGLDTDNGETLMAEN